MLCFFMFLLMTVSSAPMDLMHKRLASKSVTEMMSQPLSLALFQDKAFLSELANANPDTVNAIIDLLNDLLDASIAASIAFTTDVSTALTDKNAKTTLLAQATTNQTNANNAKTAADSAFTQATSAFNLAANHHTAMVDELNDRQPGVDEESETLRSILVLVRTLLPATTAAPTTAAPTTAPTTTAAAPTVCPDFSFDGSDLTADKCPNGWTCSSPYSASGGGCGQYNGVFVGEYNPVLTSCNGCMVPSGNDGFFFKIAWDNQCGNATSSRFSLPAAAVKATFLIGGGAANGGFWIHRTSDDSVLCSFIGPHTCPMRLEECVFPASSGDTSVYIKLEKPCSGHGGWENLVLDDIRFKDANDNDLTATTCTA